jgi:hypothetical protein
MLHTKISVFINFISCQIRCSIFLWRKARTIFWKLKDSPAGLRAASLITKLDIIKCETIDCIKCKRKLGWTEMWIVLTSTAGSLWRCQSQQSFNTLTIFNGLFLLQRIRCTYAIWCRDVTCCASVFRLCIPNTCYQLNLNIKIVNIKL